MEGLLIILLCLAGLAFVIWIWYLIVREFYRIAEYKGFPEKKYFWLTFWLGAFGVILIAMLPDRGLQKVTMPYDQMPGRNQAEVSDELPDL